VNSPAPNQLALHSVRHLVRPEIVDRVTDHVYFNNQHNEKPRVRAIINGMDVYVLTAPNTPIIVDNLTMLDDDVRSSQALCDVLINHLLYAESLPLHLLPWEVPIVLYAGRMHTHPYAITGSFGHVKKICGTNTIVIPYGRDINGVPITDPVVIQPPVPPPIPATPTGGTSSSAGPVAGNGPDPNAALIQGVLTAIQAMTQMNLEQNTRNASMTQQQSALQADLMWANQLQLRHLTNHLGNLGHEVGRAIASHPARHSHTIQATLSQPNVAPGQSNDSRTLGSLTRTVPVGLSVPSFNYGPYVQAFQPQLNDKHARRIDEATHQIIQRYLPASVKTRYDAAHCSGIVLPMKDFIDGFKYVVESRAGHGHEIYRAYYWHSSLGTGFITASGFLLQPNTQEQEFGRHAPSLASLDPTSVRLFYLDLCKVAHEYSTYVPAYEEHRPEVTFSTIECDDTPTARVPKFCESKVPQWAAIIHHHLKRDKIIPSTHPQANEIKHNPNGYEALMLLMYPYHPQFTDNGILIRPHPQQGQHSLEEHFCHCEFYYY